MKKLKELIVDLEGAYQKFTEAMANLNAQYKSTIEKMLADKQYYEGKIEDLEKKNARLAAESIEKDAELKRLNDISVRFNNLKIDNRRLLGQIAERDIAIDNLNVEINDVREQYHNRLQMYQELERSITETSKNKKKWWKFW